MPGASSCLHAAISCETRGSVPGSQNQSLVIQTREGKMTHFISAFIHSHQTFLRRLWHLFLVFLVLAPNFVSTADPARAQNLAAAPGLPAELPVSPRPVFSR